jgi:hypothetical protein
MNCIIISTIFEYYDIIFNKLIQFIFNVCLNFKYIYNLSKL